MRRRHTSFAALASALALTLALLAPASAAPSAQRADFDFQDGDQGFVPIFADYPDSKDADEFYELDWGVRDIPIEGAGKGFYLSGNNHSDDLFMGCFRSLSGLTADKEYVFRASVRIATDVDGGQIGVGGSPGSSVFVKCGITTQKPSRRTESGSHRLTIDKGNQGQDGPDMALVGNMEKEETRSPGQYEWKVFRTRLTAKADREGNVYFIFGTDSGFEATTSYYIDQIHLEWVEKEREPVTRGEAIQLLYNRAGSLSYNAPDFVDVNITSPYWSAIGWAQAEGLIAGCGEDRFGAEDLLTVEQAAVIFYRLAGSPDCTAPAPRDVAPWAEKSAAWAAQDQLLPGGLPGSAPIPRVAFESAAEKLLGSTICLTSKDPGAVSSGIY